MSIARNLWAPALNNHASAWLSIGSGFGRWAFLEAQDPWDAQNLIRGFLTALRPAVQA